MDKNNGKLTVTKNDGSTIECDILFTFDDDNLKKSYVVFTDNTLDEAGLTRVYANTYDPSGDSNDLGEVTTEKEWQVIEGLLSSLHEKVGDNSETGEEV